MPYTLLVFSFLMGSYKRIKRKYFLFIKILLFVPIVVMHMIAPPGDAFNMGLFVPPYTPWSVFYFLFSPILSLRAWLMEKDKRIRLRKLIISLFITCTVTTIFILGYILPVAYNSYFYGMLHSVIPVILIIFFLLALKVGMLGFKLRIEREHFNAMMGSMTPGAAIISHYIKNEIAKIAVCANNLKDSFPNVKYPFWQKI